jgi:hypothetical protein
MGAIGTRTMRTKLNNDSTHNAEMDTKEKWRKITLLCLSKARASTPNLSGNINKRDPEKD